MWCFNEEDTFEQAISDLLIIILIEVLHLALLVSPPEKTSFQSVAMSNPHGIYLRPDGILLVSAYPVGALSQAEPAFDLPHGEGE